MELADVKDKVTEIDACILAEIDTDTILTPGVRKVAQGTRVLMFTAPHYEHLVREKLVAYGKNPLNFVIGELPWGTRMPNSPLIVNGDKYYLQTIILKEGEVKYYMGDTEVSAEDIGVRPKRTSQGLPKEEEIVVRTFLLSNVTRLTIISNDWILGIISPTVLND